MRRPWIALFLLALSGGLHLPIAAQTKPVRRAVLIGIDEYHALKPAAGTPSSQGRGSWQDLDGCVNDIQDVKEVLKARYGFEEKDILVLTNAKATREGILGALQTHLAAPSKPGDLAFIYYSGHGSQRYNSKSTEHDKRDETIVPADSIRGAADIRDKELKLALNAVQSKGAVVTAVFDSCHSGSISRGLPAEGKARRIEADLSDVQEADDGTPTPATHGALILSAAQDFEEAKEARDELGKPHGAFTLAFLNVLRSSSTELSARDLFTRVRGALKAEGKAQEPVIEAEADRLSRPLLGVGSADLQRPLVVLQVEDGVVALQGGLADGLNPGCTLKPHGNAPASRLRLRVQEGVSLTRAKATVEGGSIHGLKLGDAFVMERFTPPASALRVHLPPALGSNGLQQIQQTLSALSGAKGFTWVEDPTTTNPTHTLAWDGKSWRLTTVSSGTTSVLGPSPSVRNFKDLDNAKDVRFYLQWPTPEDTFRALQSQMQQDPMLQGVKLVPNARDAQYVLATRRLIGEGGGLFQSAWIRPGASSIDPQDLRSPLPVRTDWQGQTEPGSAHLATHLVTLARIHGWVTLEAPPQGGFPYTMALRHAATGEVREGGVRTVQNSRKDLVNAEEKPLLIGEHYRLVLRRNPAMPTTAGPRYVYIFTMDQQGRSQLLFPPRAGTENRLPAGGTWPEVIELDKAPDLLIGEPVGTDTYFMLTSEEQLPDPGAALNWDPVLTRSSRGGEQPKGASPLGRLLAGVGIRSRGALPEAVPLDWSLQRWEFRTVSGK